ncbi:hypothetical protein DIPPA_33960 [Diplonema papillatum]|nr:hypothetical protein DIPPA_33960 [Diplonema papillatum]
MLGPDEPCAGTSARTAGLMVSLWKAKQMWKKPLRSPRSHSARPGHDVLGINKDSSSQELGKPPLSPRPPSSPMTPFNARGDLTATLLVNANLQPRYQQQQSASTSALIAELSQKCTEIEKTRDLQRDLRDKRQQLGIEFLELKAAAQRQNADLQKENQELKDTIAGLQSDLDAKGRAVTDLRRGMYKEVCLLTQQVAALRRGEAAAKNGSVELGNVLSMLDLALTGLEEPKENELSKYADQEYRRILREINVDADNGAPLKAGAALLAKYKLQQTAKNARNAKAPPPSPTSKEPMRHLHPYYKLKVAEQTLKLLQQKYALDKRVWANRQAQLQQRIRAAVNERTGLFPKYFPQYLGKSTVTAGFRIRQLHLVEEHYYLMQDSVDILKGDFCVMSNTVHDALDGFRSEFAALTASLEQLSASARVDEAELARLSPYQELAVGIVTFFKPLSTYSGEPGSPHPWSYGNRRFPLDDYIGDSCGCEALRELRPLTAELHGIYYSIMKLLLPQLDSEDAESTRRSSRNLQSGIESLQQCELTPEEAENLRVVRDTDLSHASQIVCFNFQIGFALLRMQKMLSRLATANALQVAAVRVSVESTDCLLQTLRAKKAVLQKKRKTNAENIADLWMKVHASDDEPEYTTEGTQPFVLGRSSAIAAGAALLTSDSISEESGSNPGEALD